jgi:hypothetical protein
MAKSQAGKLIRIAIYRLLLGLLWHIRNSLRRAWRLAFSTVRAGGKELVADANRRKNSPRSKPRAATVASVDGAAENR